MREWEGCFDVWLAQKEGKSISKCVFFSALVSGKKPDLPNILKIPVWHSLRPPSKDEHRHHTNRRAVGPSHGSASPFWLSLLPLLGTRASRLLYLQAESPTPHWCLLSSLPEDPWGFHHCIQVSAQMSSFERGITSFNPFALFTLFCLILLKDLLSTYISYIYLLIVQVPKRPEGLLREGRASLLFTATSQHQASA